MVAPCRRSLVLDCHREYIDRAVNEACATLEDLLVEEHE